MSRPDPSLDRVRGLLHCYGAPDASVATLLCDRHPSGAIAYTVVEPDMNYTRLTYGKLKESSERFAAALSALGVHPGDRVATLLGKCAEHLIAVMGIWRLGAVHVPLFTAFAPPAIEARLDHSGATVVVSDMDQSAKLKANVRDRQVIVVGQPADGALAFAELLDAQEPGYPAAALGGDAPIVQIYTSGTTGRPKGVVVPTAALAAFHAYQEFGLDLRADDVFWNAADPGWGYGLYFGVIGSFCVGVTSVWLNSGFSPELTWQVLSTLRVTNFTAAPTVYRSLRASGTPVPSDLTVRVASAAGEPLTPEVNEWAPDALGVPVHDHYGQTETGMVINNHHDPALRRPLVPGSMGQPMPGWTAAVLHHDRDEIAPPGTDGRIAFDLTASPLAWFSGYLGEPVRSAEKFTADHRWYLTGDTGTVDEHGCHRFRSRDDDVIIMAGYRIGPFDVESVLLTHPAVTEAAVIAAPDPVRGEVIEAFVVLRDGTAATDELAEQLRQSVKTRYAAHAYPRRVHFVPMLPKTPSGKIQRYLLRERRRAETQDVRS